MRKIIARHDSHTTKEQATETALKFSLIKDAALQGISFPVAPLYFLDALAEYQGEEDWHAIQFATEINREMPVGSYIALTAGWRNWRAN